MTPSFVVYPLFLLVGLWRLHKGGGTLSFGIVATVFLAIHLPFNWAAVFDDQSPLGADKPNNPVEWTTTLFAVQLLTAATGFLAWRQTGR